MKSALALMLVEWMVVPLAVTPSLAYMAEVTSIDGADAYGVGYGVYNTAWAIGLLIGPALGGFAFERVGFASFAHRVVGGRDRRHAAAGKGTIERLAPEGDRMKRACLAAP